MHWEHAGNSGRALTYLESAGAAALTAGAYRDAVMLLERAFSLSKSQPAEAANSPENRARWARMLTVAWLGLGRLRRAIVAVRAAATELGFVVPDTRMGWRVRLLREILVQIVSYAYVHARRPDHARSLRDAALAMDYAFECYYFANELVPMLTSSIRSVNLLDKCAVVDRTATPYARVGYVATVLGFRRLARSYFGRAATYGQMSNSSWDQVYGLCLEATAHIGDGCFARANALGSAALRASSNERNPHLRELAWTILAWSAFHTGDLDEARSRFQQLWDSGAARLNEQHAAWGACGVAAALIDVGDLRRAQEILDEAERLTHRSSDCGTVLVVLGHLLVVALATGNNSEARSIATELRRLHDQRGVTMFAELQSRIAVCTASFVLGELTAASIPTRRNRRCALAGLRAYARQFSIGWFVFLMHLGLLAAHRGRGGRVCELWRDAAQVAATLTMPREVVTVKALAQLWQDADHAEAGILALHNQLISRIISR